MAEQAGTRDSGKRTGRDREQVAWKPQPRQELALRAPAFELLFGGAAGGGKSDMLLMDFLRQSDRWGKHHRGVLFRRTYPQLEELLMRAREIYPLLGAEYHKTDKTWVFPSGAQLKFRYLERDDDVHNYQGHQYSWLGFDELTTWPTSFPYLYLMSRVRSPAGVPTAVRCTANPGGPGHAWVKERFIDPAPPEEIFYTPHGTSAVFIPSRLEDNQVLLQQDPAYEQRLGMLPDHLYRALREGDWSVFAGQVFEEFSETKHVVRPFALDSSWKKFVSMDWGYSKPFSLGWWAVTGDGRMIRYKEWYGCEDGERDKGLKLTAKEVAKRAWEMSVSEGVIDMVADPAVWNSQGQDNTIAEIFEQAGFRMEKGVNDRVSGLQRMHDLMQMEGLDGYPMMLIFDTCRAFVRTIPLLVYDEKRPEDVDTTLEDHVYDEARYGAMSPMSQMTSAHDGLDADDFNLPYPDAGYDPLEW